MKKSMEFGLYRLHGLKPLASVNAKVRESRSRDSKLKTSDLGLDSERIGFAWLGFWLEL